MAKGKHSPALFEVVHGKRHFDKSAAVLRTPNWWFKGRHRGPAAPVMDVGEPPAFADEADPTLRGLPSPTADREPEAPPPETSPAEYESAVETAAPFSMPRSRRGHSAFQFVVDRDRQELYVRVRYTAAIVAGFALVVVVALAYLGGRHVGRGPSSALASQSSEEIAAGPVEKGVLDVGTRSGAVSSSGGSYASVNPGLGTGGVSAQPAPARVNDVGPGPVAQAPAGCNNGPSVPSQSSKPIPPAGIENGRRIVGWQYVVIQAYAGDQKKLAEEARDFLIKNGVNCTVEQGVSGWPAAWHSVVSTQGFERASGAQYDTYVANVSSLGVKFAGKSAWKKFEPTPVRWKETN